MTITSANEILTIQGNPPATTRPASPNPNPATNQDLQNAARDLREAIRNNVRQEIEAARGQRAAQASTPPPSPDVPQRTFTIRGRDGSQTVIGVPATPFDNGIPPQFVDISIAFFLTVAAIIIGLPLARAFARRMDRRGASSPMSNELASQLTHLNQAVDAIALEVERISEGQRFTTRLLSEQREAVRQTLPSGAQR
jgi:hypothetical protein